MFIMLRMGRRVGVGILDRVVCLFLVCRRRLVSRFVFGLILVWFAWVDLC